MAEMGNLHLSKGCWTTAPMIPGHWSCWLVLMVDEVQQHVEGHWFTIPDIRLYTLTEKGIYEISMTL